MICVLSTPTGDLYACGTTCAYIVMAILDQSFDQVSVHWERIDRDVFCAGCGIPLGPRRRSAAILHRAMTQAAWDAYRDLEASCSDR